MLQDTLRQGTPCRISERRVGDKRAPGKPLCPLIPLPSRWSPPRPQAPLQLSLLSTQPGCAHAAVDSNPGTTSSQQEVSPWFGQSQGQGEDTEHSNGPLL